MNEILKLLIAHKIGASFTALVSTGLGASLFARLLNAIPIGWWFDLCRGMAYRVSLAGNKRLVGAIYAPVEDSFERFLTGTVAAIQEGVKAADAETKAKSAPAPAPQPPAPAPQPPATP